MTNPHFERTPEPLPSAAALHVAILRFLTLNSLDLRTAAAVAFLRSLAGRGGQRIILGVLAGQSTMQSMKSCSVRQADVFGSRLQLHRRTQRQCSLRVEARADNVLIINTKVGAAAMLSIPSSWQHIVWWTACTSSTARRHSNEVLDSAVVCGVEGLVWSRDRAVCGYQKSAIGLHLTAST